MRVGVPHAVRECRNCRVAAVLGEEHTPDERGVQACEYNALRVKYSRQREERNEKEWPHSGEVLV